MYQKTKLFILPDMKVSDIILNNPYLIMVLEYFEIVLETQDKTAEQICGENNISIELFLTIANLFNGYNPSSSAAYSFDDAQTIVRFLKNTHQYYLEEKYPKISACIKKMIEVNDRNETVMLERFFNEYFKEVTKHLNYENEIVFPYVNNLYRLLNHNDADDKPGNYSVEEYREHHDNIEEKLTDLKNLLIKYFPQKNNEKIKRKLIFNLFELEYDLNIHAQIEDSILIPLVERMEQHLNKIK